MVSLGGETADVECEPMTTPTNAARARPRLLIRSRLAKRLRKFGIGAAMPETDPAPRQTDPAPRQINEPEPK